MNLSSDNNLPYYELMYIKWAGIGYDRNKLIKLLNRLKILRFIKIVIPYYKREYNDLMKIYESYDRDKLKLLIDNDPNYTRLATIEKYARKGAIEILADAKFSTSTLDSAINFPPKDYILFHRRVNELVNLYQTVQIQDTSITKDVPGL